MTAADRFRELERQPFISTARTASASATWHSVREILAHREMLSLLVRRDLKAKYKDSALGFLWSLIRPLTQLLIYYIVLGQFLGAARAIDNFAIYIFTGLIAYGLFAEILSGATSSILGNAGLVKKVYLPREVFPLASVGSALFNFVMQLGILLVAALLIGTFPLHTGLIWALPGLAILVVWGFAFGLLLSAANVYLRDIGYLVEVLVLLLLWASPVVYSWSFVRDAILNNPSVPDWLLDVYSGNPVTIAVMCFQKAFWIADNPDFPPAAYPPDMLLRSAIVLGLGVVLVLVFQRVFARLQGNFAQEL